MSKLLYDYDVARYHLQRAKNENDPNNIRIRADAVDELRKRIFEVSRLISVQPTWKHLDLQWQLARNEQVHPVRIAELRKNRCAVEGMNKDNLSLVFGRRVLVGVFRFHTKAKIDLENKGKFYTDSFPGDIDTAKYSSPQPKDGLSFADDEREVTALYTISSVLSRAGEKLVSLLPPANYVTESPIRALLTQYSKEELFEAYRASGGEQEVKSMIIDYLAKSAKGQTKMDNATYFHVKTNGAIFAGVHVNDMESWLKSNSRTPQSEPIVNYFYDPEKREENRALCHEGMIPTAEALSLNKQGLCAVSSNCLSPRLLAA